MTARNGVKRIQTRGKEVTTMFFKITEISYDGFHWFKAETEGGCIVEADGIVMPNPIKDVKTKTLPTKKFFGSSV